MPFPASNFVLLRGQRQGQLPPLPLKGEGLRGDPEGVRFSPYLKEPELAFSPLPKLPLAFAFAKAKGKRGGARGAGGETYPLRV